MTSSPSQYGTNKTPMDSDTAGHKGGTNHGVRNEMDATHPGEETGEIHHDDSLKANPAPSTIGETECDSIDTFANNKNYIKFDLRDFIRIQSSMVTTAQKEIRRIVSSIVKELKSQKPERDYHDHFQVANIDLLEQGYDYHEVSVKSVWELYRLVYESDPSNIYTDYIESGIRHKIYQIINNLSNETIEALHFFFYEKYRFEIAQINRIYDNNSYSYDDEVDSILHPPESSVIGHVSEYGRNFNNKEKILAKNKDFIMLNLMERVRDKV